MPQKPGSKTLHALQLKIGERGWGVPGAQRLEGEPVTACPVDCEGTVEGPGSSPPTVVCKSTLSNNMSAQPPSGDILPCTHKEA